MRSDGADDIGGNRDSRSRGNLGSESIVEDVEACVAKPHFISGVQMRCEAMHRPGNDVRRLELRRTRSEEVVLVAGGKGQVSQHRRFETRFRHQTIFCARDDVADSNGRTGSVLIGCFNIRIE